MRPIKKKNPGPKSKTRIAPQKKKPLVNDLGETDTDTLSTPPDDSFHTPPDDTNLTDYNLEFTNSTVRGTPRHSPRRRQSALTQTNNNTTDKASTSRFARTITTSTVAAASHLTADSRQVKRKRRKQAFPHRREWRKLLTNTNFMIPRAPFARVIRELMMQQSSEVCMITRDALEALQTASEKYIESRFEDAYLVTLHTGRKTLFVRDMELVNCLLSKFNLN